MAELTPEAVGEPSPFPRGPWRLLEKITVWWAIGEGLLFCAIVVMSIISIVGRKLFDTPIQGDVELLQMGSAVAAATFLAVCEIYDHHIKVDALTTWMSEQGRAWLDVLAHGLLMLAAAILTWRTGLYVHEAYESQEVSSLLLIPVWWPVLLMVPSFVLLTLAALARLLVSLRIARGGEK